MQVQIRQSQKKRFHHCVEVGVAFLYFRCPANITLCICISEDFQWLAHSPFHVVCLLHVGVYFLSHRYFEYN